MVVLTPIAALPYQIVNAVMDSNLSTLIKTRCIDDWRETLALLCTYARSDEWGELCSLLAKHLANNGNINAAVLCYVCAGNVDEAVQLWSVHIKDSLSDVQALLFLLEKAVVLGLATGQRTASPVLGDLVTRYASLLAGEGSMQPALQYLEMVPGEACAATSVLRHRIYMNGATDVLSRSSVAPYPYEKYTLQPRAVVRSAGSGYPDDTQINTAKDTHFSGAMGIQPQLGNHNLRTSNAQHDMHQSVHHHRPGILMSQNFTPANQGVGSLSVTAPDPNAITGYVPAAGQTVFMPQSVSNPCVFNPPTQTQSVPQPAAFVPQVIFHM